MRIGLFKGNSWGSRLIQWQTRSTYSHAGFILEDESVIEAWYRGGVRHNASINTVHNKGTMVDVFTVKGLGRKETLLLSRWLTMQLGLTYDFQGVLGFVDRVEQRNDEKWFCSELVFAGLKTAGVELLSRIESWEVSPGMLELSPLLRFDETMTAVEGRKWICKHRPEEAAA